MSIKTALFNRLDADAPLEALVGDAIFQHLAAQSTPRNRVTYERIDEPRDSHLNGTSGLSNAEFFIYVYADTGEEREAIAVAVHDAIESDGPAQWGSTDIRRCWVTDEDDEVEIDGDGRETGRYRTRIEVSIWYIQG